jgi:hypothetical protein
MSLIPPPGGWHIAPTNPDGTLKGRLDPADTKKREEKLKADSHLLRPFTYSPARAEKLSSGFCNRFTAALLSEVAPSG